MFSPIYILRGRFWMGTLLLCFFFFASFFCMTISRFLFFTVFFLALALSLSPSLSRELGEIGWDRYLGIVLVLSMGLHWERGFGGFWSIHVVTP